MPPDLDVIADPTRRLMLALLAVEPEICVCEFVAALREVQPKCRATPRCCATRAGSPRGAKARGCTTACASFPTGRARWSTRWSRRRSAAELRGAQARLQSYAGRPARTSGAVACQGVKARRRWHRPKQ
ncbi:MAG: helix-turn-helix transcriptional regulator [Betaproteobacteria bacterium]|nr:helix-turn-helix transcriptional regulator [Betaproteobacteria bacterium]